MIVYAGGTHSRHYVDFMKYLNATLLTEHPHIIDNRCIASEASMIPNLNDFRRIYKIVNPEISPVTVQQIGLNPQVQLINFSEATRKLNAGDFLRFNFLPEYQVILHKQGNYIATFYGHDGNIYLTELQYNQATNQILPPV